MVTQTVRILNASVSISCFDTKLQFCKILVITGGKLSKWPRISLLFYNYM